MPESPVHDYDHLLSVAETLVQTAQEHAERAATARQQAALVRWQKKLQISSKTDKKTRAFLASRRIVSSAESF